MDEFHVLELRVSTVRLLCQQVLESRARSGMPDRPEAVGGDQVRLIFFGKISHIKK